MYGYAVGYSTCDNELFSDSRQSTLSTVQDLNSASSLSWADDEIENLAAFKIQTCLERLDLFLSRGIESRECFDLEEGQQWRDLIRSEGLVERLSSSRVFLGTSRPVTASLIETTANNLKVTGQSIQFSLPQKDTCVSLPPLRSASAYPNKQPVTRGFVASARAGRTSFSSFPRTRKALVEEEKFSLILDDTARLTISEQINEPVRDEKPSVSTSRAASGQVRWKRPKLQQTLPLVKEKEEFTLRLPPLEFSSGVLRSATSKPARRISGGSPSAKSPALNRNNQWRDLPYKPASAVPRQLSPVKDDRFFYNPPTFRNYKNDLSLTVSVVGTSYDPVVRPARISKVKKKTT